MMGSLMMLGIAPGPLLFTQQAPTVYSIFIGLFLANVIMGILGFSSIRFFAKVINISSAVMVPIIFTFCFVGTFALNNSLNDIYFMIIAGIIGYFLIKLDFSMPPIVLGLVLGKTVESNFRRALVLSRGNYWTFLERPISAAFIVLAILSVFSPMIISVIKRLRKGKPSGGLID